MKMALTTVSALLVGLAAVAFGACGGPETKPKAEVIRKADAACSRRHRQEARLSQPTVAPDTATAKDMPAIAAFLKQDYPIVKAQIDDVRKAGPPDRDRALFDRTLAAADRLVKDFAQARDAAARGDVTGFKAAFAKIRTNESGRLAKQFGFKVCG